MNKNKLISRRSFLKTAFAVGVTLGVNTAMGKMHAAENILSRENGKKPTHDGMEYRVLGSGSAALEVSALGFGCMGLNYNRSQAPDKKECIRIVHEAVDRGVTLFDTAIIYGPLRNELLAGEALAPYKGKVVLTTKFGHEVIDGKAPVVKTAVAL